MTLAALLAETGRGPDDLAVHAAGHDHSRADLVARAEAIAAALRDIGVAPRSPVGVLLPNGVDVVAALFGVWMAGGVYVPLNPRGALAERRRIVADLDVAVLVTTADHVGESDGRAALVLSDGVCRPEPGRVASRTLDDGVALVQFTSGTTGEPKAVQLTHDGVLELLDGVLATLRTKPSSGPPMPNLVPVSLSLWAGIYQLLFATRVGAAVVVMDGFDPVEFRDLVARFGIRSTVLPPAAMAALVDDERVTDLAPLHYVRSITAPLSPLQARRFRDRFGIAVLNSYGQTEIGGEIVGWSAADSREHGDTKLGSVGRPHRGVEVRAVDDHGAVLGPGVEGELWVMTPALASGYADGSDLADRLSPDGWFRTGDVGYVDADGFVWITGRVSDMINRGGLKVHPGEVEEVLRLHPDVADAAVAGVPDPRSGEVPWAFVVTRRGTTFGDGMGEALDAVCRDNLAPYKVPVRFEAVDELPRNEVGKVLRRALIEQVAP